MDDTDAMVERILGTYDTITVVGASTAPHKAAHSVPAHMQQHGWRIIPVNPHASEILGEPVYRTLADVPGPVGLVDVFRPSPLTPDIARQAVAVGATALWLQLGIASEEARAIADRAGMLYVEDRCLIIEQRRLGLRAPSENPCNAPWPLTSAVPLDQQASSPRARGKNAGDHARRHTHRQD
jgi:predicted CoA-binding protein